MGNTQTVYLPPWVPATDEEHANADAYTEAVRAISAVPRNFIEPDAVVHSADFSFDWTTHRAFAEAAYRGDVRLGKLLPRLVPKHVTEEEFWRNYFSRVYAVKQRFSPGGAPDAPTDAPAPPAAEPPVVPAEEPAEEEPAQRQKDSAGISDATSAATQLVRAASLTSQLPYPERFELAVKFVKEGPSLPEDAAPGDRILMDVLSQQAIIGQCNVPRPGMWDTAEAKARHDAWVKLGSMSKHEAMHLYVQALEIFCKEWVLWEGLHITPEMAKRADAVTTMTPTRPFASASDAADGIPAAPQFDATANGTSTPSARMPPTGALPASPPRALANGKAASSQKADSPAEQLFLLDISPSSRAVAILINMMPAASRVQVHVVASIADLPDPVQKGCAKLPLLLSAGTGFELWDAHAIMGYLADKYASPGRVPPSFSFPSDIEGRAKLQQFLAYRQATLWPAVRDHVFAQLFPASPVCPVSRGPALREYVENAERRLQMELNRLNTVFLDSTPFLASATPSAADVSCACAISLLDWVSNPRIEHYPNVAAWYLAITNLPGYKEVSQAHKRFAATPNNVQQGHFALALIE